MCNLSLVLIVRFVSLLKVDKFFVFLVHKDKIIHLIEI